jgi:hypothetical protein
VIVYEVLDFLFTSVKVLFFAGIFIGAGILLIWLIRRDGRKSTFRSITENPGNSPFDSHPSFHGRQIRFARDEERRVRYKKDNPDYVAPGIQKKWEQEKKHPWLRRMVFYSETGIDPENKKDFAGVEDYVMRYLRYRISYKDGKPVRKFDTGKKEDK